MVSSSHIGSSAGFSATLSAGSCSTATLTINTGWAPGSAYRFMLYWANVCPAGFYGNGVVCTACAAGTYATTGGGTLNATTMALTRAQFSASSYFDAGTFASTTYGSFALDSTGFNSAYGCWLAMTSDYNALTAWMQMDLLSPVTVTAVVTQGRDRKSVV